MRVLDCALFRADLKARMPFRYGIATLTEVPHVFVQLRCRFPSGEEALGMAADHLPPKWFTKDPARDPTEEIDDMLGVIRQASRLAAEMAEADTVFRFWRELWERMDAWAEPSRIPPLLSHFGVSLVERAVIDAFCRAHAVTFGAAVRKNLFAVDLGEIHPSLARTMPADWLPSAPADSVIARHAVGLADPISESEIAPGDRVTDGLPQSLEACIRAYGLRHFKVKLGPAADLSRLRAIASTVARLSPADHAFTLDGNESFTDVDEFRAAWEQIRSDPALQDFRSRLLFVEQPFHRDVALGAPIAAMCRNWPDRPPLAIDESDADLSSLARAIDLGYEGATHKNCKGVFKGLAHACLIAKLRRDFPQRLWSLTGEDLANIGPVALLQDLAVQASLGITTVERNGHHYFAGLSFWPRPLQETVRSRHPDLYRQTDFGWPAVRIENGLISTASVTRAPFGTGFDFDPASVGVRL